MFDDALAFLSGQATRDLAHELGQAPESGLVKAGTLSSATPSELGITLTLLRVEPISLRAEQRFRATGGQLESLSPRSFRLQVLASSAIQAGKGGYGTALDLLGRFTTWVVDNPEFQQESQPELSGHPLERLNISVDKVPLGDVLMLWQSFGVSPRPALVLEVEMLAYGDEAPKSPEVTLAPE